MESCAASGWKGAACRQSWKASWDRHVGPDRQLTSRLALT
jgi:hypothetical protein